MRSPFPGMDPYIEESTLWGGFHHHLIEEIARHLADNLPDRYFVRTEERSYNELVEEDGKERRGFTPDVTVVTPGRRRKTAGKKAATIPPPANVKSTVEPVLLCAFIDEEHREGFIEIHEAEPEMHMVTTIEVLSPSNKKRNSEGWNQYLRKRQSTLLDGVHFVEIDLLRGGDRMPMVDPWPPEPYYLMVARANKAPARCHVYPADFRTPLPPIPVPLEKPDADVWLDLQPFVDTIYRRYKYARSLDYTRPLKRTLSQQDHAWLQQQLRLAKA